VKQQWKLTVDRTVCIGAGVCAGMAPERFCLGADGKSYPVSSFIDPDPTVLDAAYTCPSEAITVIKLAGYHHD
jgi:ferredoxin